MKNEKKQKEYKNNNSGKRNNNSNHSSTNRNPAQRSSDTERDGARNVQRGKKNHMEWYNHNPQLTADAGSLSFNTPNGIPVDLADGIGTGFIINDTFTQWMRNLITPGVMKISYVGVPGISKDSTSAVNVAAKNIYSFVRHANSGHANYDPADLMLYFLAMDSCYSFLTWMQRAYAVLMGVSGLNRYNPRAIAYACGIDYDDGIANLADFRGYINTFAARTAQFYVPDVLDYFKRHSWMNANVFMDADVPKAQFYVFEPEGFYRYVETEGAGKLELTKLPTSSACNTATVSAIKTYGETLLQALIDSEDIGIMSGDVLKAYGDKLFSVTWLPETTVLVPTYDPDVLLQIHNANAFGFPGTTAEWAITQSTDLKGNLLFKPEIANVLYATAGMSNLKTILDIRNPNPDPLTCVYATRLITSIDGHAPGVTVNKVASCGTEIVTRFNIMSYAVGDGGALALKWSTDFTTNEVVALDSKATLPNVAATIASQLRELNSLANFDWAPRIDYAVMPSTNANETNVFPGGLSGDVDTWRTLSSSEVKKLHECALLSLFSIPADAKNIK